MVDYKILTSAIVFTTIMGFLLNSAGYMSYSIISPTVFLIGEGLLVAAIALANTPVAKGVAVASFAVWLFAFFLNIQLPYFSEILYALLFIPNVIVLGFMMLEVGQG